MVVPDRRHKCGHANCPVCHEWVLIHDHKCYIQPVVEEERHTEEPTEEPEGGGRMVAPPRPLFVYADFEAMQNAEGVFVANLLRRRGHSCLGGGGLCPAVFARSGRARGCAGK